MKGQFLDHAQHVAVGQALGEVTIAHISLGGIPDHPQIFSLRRVGRDADASDAPTADSMTAPAALTATESTQSGTTDASRGWKGWHTDITASLNPPAVSILRADKIPSMNADTTFTNLATVRTQLQITSTLLILYSCTLPHHMILTGAHFDRLLVSTGVRYSAR